MKYWCLGRAAACDCGTIWTFLLYVGFRYKITLLQFITSIQKCPTQSLLKYRISVLPASVAQLDAPSDWRPGGCGLNPRRGRQHSFVEIDHGMFSTAIFSLPLIQEGQLSVSGKRMYTILVNRLED